MRPEMCAMISWPFSSFTRHMVFGRVSEIVPSNSMTSSFAMRPGLLREVGLGRPTSRVFCHVAGLGAKFPLIGLRGCGQHAGGEFAETLRPRPRDGRLRSEEHTSELQSLMRISYAVFCLKKKKQKTHNTKNKNQHKKIKTDSMQ